MADHDLDLFVIGAGSGGVRAARIAAGYGATRHGRRGVPGRRHLRDPRLRSQEAAGLRLALCRRVRGRGRLRLDAGGTGLRLADTHRQQGPRDRAARARLYHRRSSAPGSSSSRAAPCSRTRTPCVSSRPARKIRPRHILIATGAAPWFGPAIPGIEHVISSNEAFHLEELPKRILIQGGGYIAVEFASIFNGLGSEVTLVYRGENILRGFDDDLREHLHAEMTKRGVQDRLRQDGARRAMDAGCFQRHAVRRQHGRSRQGDVRDRALAERRRARSGSGGRALHRTTAASRSTRCRRPRCRTSMRSATSPIVST